MRDLAPALLDYALLVFVFSAAMTVVALCLRNARISPNLRAHLLFVALLVPALAPLALMFKRNQGGSPTALAGHVMSVHDNAAAALELTPYLVNGLVLLWVSVTMGLLLRLVMGWIQLRRTIKAALPIAALDDVSTLRLSAIGPLVVGVRRPTILLPAPILEQESLLRAVVLHEQAHIARGDLLTLAVQRLLEAVFWWNPCQRHLVRHLETARELACDAAASRQFPNGTDYAEALLDIAARLMPQHSTGALTALAMASPTVLQERIDALLAEPRATLPSGRGASLLVFLVAIYGASYAGAQIPVLRAVSTNESEDQIVHARQALHAELERTRQALEADYERSSQALQADFERSRQAMEAEHQRVRQDMESEHQRTRQAMDGEHQRTRQAIEAEHERLRQTLARDLSQSPAAQSHAESSQRQSP